MLHIKTVCILLVPNIAGPTLTIPAIIHKHEIDQIGRNAFSQCPNIEEVFISDSIRVINTAAFSECPNLRSVLIPSSIEFIGNLGIHGYNVTLDNINPNLSTKSYTGKGMMKVIFHPNSRIQYIGQYGISRKENIIIYYYGTSDFFCENDIFFLSAIQSAKIIAPYSSKFCRYNTIYARTFVFRRRLLQPNVYLLILIFQK